VAVIIAGSLAIVATRMRVIPFYISSDAGHYLADADALFGNGVRENRHPPLFPLLVGLINVAVRDDLLTIKVAIATTVAVLIACFYIFIKGRTGSKLGDFAATGLFALAPTTAEAIGWFGGASLIGLALSLLALRFISDLAAQPTPWRSVAAAAAVVGVVLSHPFSVAFLAETVAVYLGLRIIARALRLQSGRTSFHLSIRGVWLLCVPIAAAAAAFALAHDSYGGIENPLTLGLEAQQLQLIWTWAFRNDTLMWLALLGLSLMIVPLARWTGGEHGFDMGIAVSAMSAVVFFNVAFLQGDSSYVTRSLYFVPVAAAATFGAATTALTRVSPRALPSVRTVAAVAAVALTVFVSASAADSFVRRLDVALPYYNFVDQHEIAAIDYLAGRSGTVILTPKGSDLEAGTQYSWIIEGIAHVRAWGSGTSLQSLRTIADQETATAERFAIGPADLENGQLRVAFDGTTGSGVKLVGSVGGTWYPLFDIEPHDASSVLEPAVVSTIRGPGYGQLSSSVAPNHAPATIRLDDRAPRVQVVIPTNQLGSSGQIDLIPASARGQFTVTGTGITWKAALDNKAVAVNVNLPNGGGNGTKAVVSGQGSVVISPRQGSDLTIDMVVTGLTGRLGPVSTHKQTQLIRDNGIQFLWTWRSTQEINEYAARTCLALAFENDAVAIFHVDPSCHG